MLHFLMILLIVLVFIIVYLGAIRKLLRAIDWSEPQADSGARLTLIFIMAACLAFVLSSCHSKPAPTAPAPSAVDTTRLRLEKRADQARYHADSLKTTSKTATPYASATAWFDSLRAGL